MHTSIFYHLHTNDRRRIAKGLDILQGEVAMSDMAGSTGPVEPVAGQIFANPLAPPHSRSTAVPHVECKML